MKFLPLTVILLLGEPYEAKLTSITFSKPICIIALEIHTLQPLTGAEDVEITYNLCEDSSNSATGANATWTLTHYTNKKNVFVLRHPILARKLAVVAGLERNRNSPAMAILDVDIKQCNVETIFGSIQTEEDRKCQKANQSVTHQPHHRHRTHAPVLKVSEAELDQLLLGHIAAPSRPRPRNDSIEAVFIRSKRQTPEKVIPSFNATSTNSGVCPLGFYGERCEIPDCSSQGNCSNAGTCVQPNICKCAPNYFGADCSQCSGWFCNQCDFFCVHGQCDTITKSCICRRGWSGAACDVCSRGNCSTEPMVKLILPQTAEWVNENGYVYVHGSDLPKSEDMRYHCMFGGISTAGNWLSSSLVRCSIPSRAKHGKHVFNVIPFGSKVYVPNENSKTVHFTFFIPCNSSSCRGHCFGPTCLCDSTQKGQRCDAKAEPLTSRIEELKDPSINNAKEGELYIVQIPTQSPTAVMKVFSSISDLEMDPFKHTVTWRNPRGGAYNINTHLIDEKTDLGVFWSLSVDPSYTPLTGKVEKSGINNGWLLKGFIEFTNNNTNLNTVPILLEILSSTQPNTVLESFEITSDSRSTFSHLFYPHSGTKETETYTVRAKHPGKVNDTTNCATWTLKRLAVESATKTVNIENGIATANYTSNLNNVNCPNFDVTVIQPAAGITVTSFERSGDDVAANFATSHTSALPRITNVTIAFMCDSFSGMSITQGFHSRTESPGDFGVYPKTLEFYTSISDSPQFVPLEIVINSIPSNLEESLITDAALLPFYVAASNPPYLNNPTIYRNGSKIEMLLGLSQSGNANDGEGVIQFPNAKQPLIKIPYRIRRIPSDGLELTIVAKGFVTGETNVIDYPLDVTIRSSRGELIVRRMIYLNVPSEFYPLPTGFYHITIQSFSFNSVNEIFHLTPNSDSFETYLFRKPQTQFVFNGKRVKLETIKGSDDSLPAAAEIIIQPSIFYSSHLNQELFANFVFHAGPNNATAVIGFENQNPSLEFILERDTELREALKPRSGIRSQIKVGRNAKYVPKEGYSPPYCNIVKQSLPFFYAVDGSGEDFEGKIDYVVDKRATELDKAVICGEESSVSSIPELTTVVLDCAAAKILECRAFYQPIQSCGSGWKDIPDDTVSIHVYALFMNLKADCKLSDVDLKTVQALIECISSLDIDCPLAKPAETEAPVTSSPFNSLLNQMKSISSLTQSLHGFFPALSTLEAQLIDFPNHMADFLHHFELAFPSSDFANIRSRAWFDSFYSAISDASASGPVITFAELEAFPSWRDGRNLILRWNDTCEQLKGENLISPANKESRVLLLRKLVEKADKLKSLGRQFAANEPFSMLHDILATIFARVDSASNATEECATAIGFVEPSILRESQEFEVSIVITNVMSKQILQNLRFQLEMLHSSPSKNQSHVNYRIGPLFYSGGIPSYLSPRKALTVSWKIHPVFDRRLTETIKEQPNVILTFDLNGKRKVQRIRIPQISIQPDRHLRVYALAFPEVLPRFSDQQPFSLAFHIMNSGFSLLRNIQLAEFSPWLIDTKETQMNANFRLNSVKVDGKFDRFVPKILVETLESGKTSVVTMNLTTLGGQVGQFKNCSITALVDDKSFPEFFDYKFFFVQESVGPHTFILSDKEPQNYKGNLFYFNPTNSMIKSLHQIQLIKEIPSEEQHGNRSHLSVLATFQRLMSPDEMRDAASAEALKQIDSTVYGRIQYPEGLKEGHQLVRVCEIGPGGVRRHLLNLEDTWIAKKGNVSQLNFIDSQALPPALASQLTYEFIFAKPEDFNLPYFTQHYYQQQLPENMVIQKFTVIGKVTAESPLNSPLNYSLISDDNSENFVMNTKTGELILASDSLVPTNESSLCFNVLVTDSRGRKSAVPLEVLLPSRSEGIEGRKRKCSVFQSETPIVYHEFKGDRSSLKMIEFHSSTFASVAPTRSSEIGELVSVSTNFEDETTTEASPTRGTSTAIPTETSTESVILTTKASIIETFETSTSATPTPATTENTQIEPTEYNSETTVPSEAFTPFYTPKPTEDLGAWEQTKITDDDVPTETTETATEAESYTSTKLTEVYTPPTKVSFTALPPTTQAVRTKTTPIVHQVSPDDFLSGTTEPTRVEISTFETEPSADWYTEGIATTEEATTSGVTSMNPQLLVPSANPTQTWLPLTTPGRPLTNFLTIRPTLISKPFPTPPLFTPAPLTISPTTRMSHEFITLDNAHIDELSTAKPRTLSPLPVATRISISNTPSPNLADILGQIPNAGFNQQSVGVSGASMVDTACRLRSTKPIWAVVCDMAKTVKWNN